MTDVYSGKHDLLPPSSGYKSKPRKRLTSFDQQVSFWWLLLCLIFDPEDGDITFLRNVGEQIPDSIAQHPRDSTLLRHSYENLTSSVVWSMWCTGWFMGMRGTELIIRNNAIIYRWKLNLASTYLFRCGDNSVTQDAEIGFPPPGDAASHYAPRPRMLRAAWHEGITVWRKWHEPARQAGRHRVSVAKLCFITSRPPNDFRCTKIRDYTLQFLRNVCDILNMLLGGMKRQILGTEL
jgi:hypothetical protein